MNQAETPNLILQEPFDPLARRALLKSPQRPLIDSPRIDGEAGQQGFSWRPTLLIIAGVGAAMLAIAYL